MSEEEAALASDLLWGGRDIAKEVFGKDDPKTVQRTHYLLERGRIDADKVGDRWVSTRQRLRNQFRGKTA